MRYELGGLTFGGAYTWRGLFSEFYGMSFLDGNAKENSGSCCYNYFFPSFFFSHVVEKVSFAAEFPLQKLRR